ncbi:MAG: glycosyltransferase [Candidatus Hermodarchaeota archaeon]
MDNIEISVILPVRDESKTLLSAVKSLLNQDIDEIYEIIIIDGSSTNLVKSEINVLLENYPNRIKYFKNEKKKFASGMNFGTELAQGKYIVEFNAHIEAPVSWLRTIYESLISNPSIVKVGTVHETLNKKNHVAKSIDIITNSFIGGSWISTFARKETEFVHSVAWGIVAKKDVQKVRGYDEVYDRGSDLDLNKKLGNIGKILKLGKPTIKHRKPEKLITWFKKMIYYGKARVVLIKRNYRPKIDLIPTFPIISAIPFFLICYLSNNLPLFLLISSLYFLIFIITSIYLAFTNRFFRFDLLIIVALIMHLGYTIGVISAIFEKS